MQEAKPLPNAGLQRYGWHSSSVPVKGSGLAESTMPVGVVNMPSPKSLSTTGSRAAAVSAEILCVVVPLLTATITILCTCLSKHVTELRMELWSAVADQVGVAAV